MTDKNEDKSGENLFKIIDGIIFQLNKTKKMFIIMILTVMIIPPLLLLITFEILSPPVEITNETNQNGTSIMSHRPHHLQFMIMRYIPTIVSLIWLGIGIRQWLILSKWTKKYDEYKELQEKIDKELDSDGKEKKQ